VEADNITPSTPYGTVVGRLIAKNEKFICYDRINYTWYLQIRPNAPQAGSIASICRTRIDGIGIQYLDYQGNPIPCNGRGAIFSVPARQQEGVLREGTVLARLIRIGGQVSHGPHVYMIGAKLDAYYYGYTASTEWGDFQIVGNYFINVTQYSPQIFFPSSPTSTPVVNLHIDNNFHGKKAFSPPKSQNLDMCLYDGDNASSNGITLTFSDDASGTVGRAPEDFSIFRNGGSRSSINDRLDYLVSIANPVTGSQEQVKNGVATYWSYGANAKKRTRQVVLPGVPGVSLCIPAPITISTPSMDISGKSSGNYSGVLRVIYTPSTYTN